MTHFKPRFFYWIMAVLFIIGILTLRPIENITAGDCRTAEGTIILLDDRGGEGDIYFALEGDTDVRYYINRGVESGVDPRAIDGRYVLLRYADHWSPMDPFGKNRHVAELIISDQVFYSELVLE